jgi:hypothetical protein
MTIKPFLFAVDNDITGTKQPFCTEREAREAAIKQQAELAAQGHSADNVRWYQVKFWAVPYDEVSAAVPFLAESWAEEHTIEMNEAEGGRRWHFETAHYYRKMVAVAT